MTINDVDGNSRTATLLDVVDMFGGTRPLRNAMRFHGIKPPEANAMRMWKFRKTVPPVWAAAILKTAVLEDILTREVADEIMIAGYERV
jgi:hypothetical protein